MRRDKGEGTISKRTDGSWAVALSLGNDREGKRVRKQATCKTKKEAAAKLREWISGRDRQVDLTKDTMTLSFLIDCWLDNARKRVRQTTLRSYEQVVRLHLRPGLGDMKVVSVSAFQLDKFFAQKQASGLSVRTVGYLRTVLHQIFEQGRKYDVVVRNVVELTESITESNFEGISLTHDQVRQLDEVLWGDVYGLYIMASLAFGTRPSELRGLRWKDVHFAADGSAGTVDIVQQIKDRPGGGYTVSEPKTKRGRRKIPMPGHIEAALRFHRIRQDAQRSADQTAASTAGITFERPQEWSDLVFLGGKGLPVSDSYVRKKFKTALKSAGLDPAIRLYDLRHTYNSLLADDGVSAMVRRDLMGHRTTELVDNVYGHSLPHSTSATADIVNSWFGPKT